MSELEYFRHDDSGISDILASAFAGGNLVPVIGAGFTRGCASKSRTVPSGEEFKVEMLCEIVKHRNLDGEQEAKLGKKTFSEVADYYFDEAWVPKDVVIAHLDAAFKGVVLPEDKQSFINDIGWPYIYTLNVDDAIESCSSFEKALPYNDNLSERAKTHPTVFKLHGDIDYEVRHDDSRLVFRKADYLQALSSNRRMLDFLTLDLVNKNILYIGCSLSDELDIAFIVAKQNKFLRRKTRNIIFLTERLDSIDQQQYENVGINCVILIDEGRYDQIYSLVALAYQKSAMITNSLKEFSGGIRELSNDSVENQDFLAKGVVEINQSVKKYRRVLPYYYSRRAIESAVELSLKKNEITVINGARVSGRTLTAYSVLHRIRDKSIYIVDSTSRIGGKSINQLLGQNNAVIFFDSLTLSRDELWQIGRLRKQLLANNSRVLLCSEAYSRDVEQILQTPGASTGVFHLRDQLTNEELAVLNSRAIESRLPTFTVGKYILDKIYNVFSIIGEKTYISKIPQSADLFKVLYVLAVRGQFTGQEIYFAGLQFNSVDSIVQKNSPYLEFDQISVNEQIDHTSFKVVTHAGSWAVSLLREIFRVKGGSWCVDTLMELFAASFKNNRLLVTELRKFDSINFIFGAGQKGAASLIISLYDRLEVLEGSEAEFYVQKAKAYYNMYHGDDLSAVLTTRIKELERAQTWAVTASQTTTIRNIVHVKASICLRRVIESKLATEVDFIEAIEALLETIRTEGNSVYLRNFLEGKTRGSDYLTIFMERLRSGVVKYPILLTMRGKISELESKIDLAQQAATQI